MPEPTAIWGAATGTAALSLAVYREVVSRKKRMSVAHGWHFAFESAGDEITDVWVYVMAWNTGARPLSIEHCGFSWLEQVDPQTVRDETGLEPARVFEERRAEISLLGDDPIEVAPDGPSVKVMTRLGPLLATGVDPLADEVIPFVVTAPDRYWYGPASPLLPQLPLDKSRGEVVSALATIRDDSEPALKIDGMYALTRFLPRGIEPDT